MEYKKVGKLAAKTILFIILSIITYFIIASVILLTEFKGGELLWMIAKSFVQIYGVFFLVLLEVLICYIIKAMYEGRGSQASARQIFQENKLRFLFITSIITIISYILLLLTIAYLIRPSV